MDLYRCSKCKFIRDLSGEGAFRYGGRWNSKGVRIIYTASNPSLALLETLVHTAVLIPSMDYCLLNLKADSNEITVKEVSHLPVGWNESPAPEVLKQIGDQFIKESKFLLLKVPSAILPMEWNYLINPGHVLFRSLQIQDHVKVVIDQRLKTTTESSDLSLQS